jgi:hypothetical protein
VQVTVAGALPTSARASVRASSSHLAYALASALRRGAPALARALLEQAHRVPVAAGQVVQLRLLQRGGQRYRHRVVGQAAGDADGGDGGRVGHLVDVQVEAALVGAADLAGRRRGHVQLLAQAAAAGRRAQHQGRRRHQQQTTSQRELLRSNGIVHP